VQRVDEPIGVLNTSLGYHAVLVSPELLQNFTNYFEAADYRPFSWEIISYVVVARNVHISHNNTYLL
jgi:hypothetical protein